MFNAGVLGWVAVLGISFLTQGSRFLSLCDLSIFNTSSPGFLWKGGQHGVGITEPPFTRMTYILSLMFL